MSTRLRGCPSASAVVCPKARATITLSDPVRGHLRNGADICSRTSDVSIVDFSWSRSSLVLYFHVWLGIGGKADLGWAEAAAAAGGGDSRSNYAWVEADRVKELWPRQLLKFYLDNLKFKKEDGGTTLQRSFYRGLIAHLSQCSRFRRTSSN
jgi:hypothetical protein